MRYTDYSEIPAKVRRFILDESGARRVKQISLAYCNELADEYFEYEEECAELKKFELQVQEKNGHVTVTNHQSLQEALVAFDREIDYNIGSRGKTMVITQAGRPMRGYQNGKVIFPSTIYEGLSRYRG
jgi:hypothetical protein